jgi:hypothetical protein
MFEKEWDKEPFNELFMFLVGDGYYDESEHVVPKSNLQSPPHSHVLLLFEQRS